MSKSTNIAWCDSTFNPWIGCTEIGPGCDHCYAEVQDSRKRWGGTTHWGAGVARYRTSASNWAQPLKWNKAAAASGKMHRVFCASLADVFDNEVPARWRDDLWKLILATPNLSWLLVTKRIGNVSRFVYPGWLVNGFPPNVRLLITVCNQEEADRDIPKLLALPCKNGISYEPALGPVDWSKWNWIPHDHSRGMIEWIIVGGESAQAGHEARAFNLEWARSTVRQCSEAGTACFVKQFGGFVIGDANDLRNPGLEGDTKMIGDGRGGALARFKFKDRAGADPEEWPEDLRVRDYPD